VKKIVEGHHGSVEVESTEGEGTSLSVLLPLTHKESGTEEPAD